MIVCEANDAGDTGSWYTEYIEIPYNTPPKSVEKRAVNAMFSKLRRTQAVNIAHVGIYCIPPKNETMGYECRFCTTVDQPKNMHLHQGFYVCDGCWDERLRITE